ncbi:MAG: inorganic phosphate transporter [Flavobacteriaceae bacterium]|nr:inorganic phosphate transporter [Flavobacteriaceae bacterium]
MENYYYMLIVALGFLAILDLVVGVSNDAVNFLNSAIGSKAVSMRTILIVASIGIVLGAISSSGMMEVARSGIFVPGKFYFSEIMIIFMAVMLTDIILLDFFNTLGLPTSTTVSIVFELLGAAVAMALIKISADSQLNYNNILDFINQAKAVEIISGILISVVIAFTIGALVQFLTRLLLTFNFEKKPKYYAAIFAGLSLISITYFIVLKSFKGTSFDLFGSYFESHKLLIFGAGFVIWAALSYLLIALFKVNIYKIIIVAGTFALAMAFAGNDLVNFIGVPIAAFNSYEAWSASGVLANEYSMEALAGKVPTPTIFLLIAGVVMVLTLWFSKKARSVAATEVNLARQDHGHERFEPNPLSRGIVRFFVNSAKYSEKIMPKSIQNWIGSKFEKPVIELPKNKTYEMPAFDMVRASTNLMVAGILIAFATSLKLPLSTTYVTFMVAMGTSLADKAWGRDSAVYRVSGVLSVIGGWFFTAFMAFSAAAIFTYFIHIGGGAVIAVLLMFVLFNIVRNYLSHAKKYKETERKKFIKNSDLKNIQNVITESSEHISQVVKRVNKLYTNVVEDLSTHDLNKLTKTNKHVKKLNEEIDELKDDVFYFIKSLDDSSVNASRFYIMVLGYLQDVAQSISYISKSSHKHVQNNHPNLKESQITDLKYINKELTDMLKSIEAAFETKSFDLLSGIINEKQGLFLDVSNSIEKQVSRIRTEESSPKNSTLYFGILLETKDLISAIMNILQLYEEYNIASKK